MLIDAPAGLRNDFKTAKTVSAVDRKKFNLKLGGSAFNYFEILDILMPFKNFSQGLVKLRKRGKKTLSAGDRSVFESS